MTHDRKSKMASRMASSRLKLTAFADGKGQVSAWSQIVDDEQGYGYQELHVLFARAIEGGFVP